MPEARGEARLFVLAGPDLARSFALGERSTLGRSDECDVVLHDRSISRKHAVLVRQGELWFVQDLGSTNGVSKDGKRAERIELADGDEFKLGDLPLRLRLSAPAVAQDIEFDSSPPGAPAPAVRAPVPPSGPKPSASNASGGNTAEPDEIEIEGPDAPHQAALVSEAATLFRPPRVARRTGLFSADLSQQPLWLRGLLALGLLALGAGLAYGAYRAVLLLRSGL
jgi:predicted component of type VI protein secretion system